MDLIPIIAYLIGEEDYNRNNLRIIRRHLRDEENPFEIPDNSFKKFYRLSKEIVIHEVLQPLQNHVQGHRRQDAIPFHLKVLATINFLATGSDQKAIGNALFACMSQTSISLAINEICPLITNHLAHRWIKFPRTREEKNNIQEGFSTKWQMRGIIGAIDGTHVEIVAPPSTDEEHQPHLYINRKGRHSINVMLICDSDCRITGLNARFPGSVHDAAIWQTSSIREILRHDFNMGNRNHYLIGDSGYGLEPWLLTPINNAIEGTPEYEYNIVLKRARNVVERTNGLLKAKFRCLSKCRMLQYHPTISAYIIYTCGILYNMDRGENGEINDYEYEEEQNDGNQQEFNNILHLEAADIHQEIRNAYIQDNFM